jgi:hypothetical protein
MRVYVMNAAYSHGVDLDGLAKDPLERDESRGFLQCKRLPQDLGRLRMRALRLDGPGSARLRKALAELPGRVGGPQDEPVRSGIESGGLLKVGPTGDVEVEKNALDWPCRYLLRCSSGRCGRRRSVQPGRLRAT